MKSGMNDVDRKVLSRSLLDIAWSFGPKGLDGSCCQDLGMAEFLALDGISRIADCPVQQVGHSLGFTKSGATRIVSRLVMKGYVSKRSSGHDARVCCLEVTEHGREMLSQAYAQYGNLLNRVFSGLDETEKGELQESLIRFSTLLMRENYQEENR
ncbi:MAG: MarR family winged helix-turn-helix transcriptional regulator [Sphaerochaeta sp.]|jgi:DNA-binding MarR family transcriptional regulator|nr:MarR family winged helix-turn-helix transcriptional regulator [Sphaerochaeta sp.]PKL29385.1 MAG: MarR family transcriptional regulator [Spirochaetae bacterium HGW-Spirochaetae-2]